MGSPIETISLGCRLNGYETERMAQLAADAGRTRAVVINTCAVTGEAVRQSRQSIRKARRENPDAEIIVSGCAVQLDADGFSAMDEVDRVIGNADKLSPAAWATPGPVSDVFEPTTLPEALALKQLPQVRAHLEVQNGCDHRCTFCIIPFGRGNARSKPVDAILREAEALAALGAKEIVLTGVDLTSYGPDLGSGMSLADPIEALIRAMPDDIGIRLSSLDGPEVDDRLFDLVTGSDRIMPHLHLSLQAGDTMILKRMKRRHSRDDAVDLCHRLKAARPELALGADLIAGFPTETEAMFENTLALVTDCDLAYVHVFPFSPRAGTPAALMPQLDRSEVKQRAAALRQAADAALGRHLSRWLDRPSTFLVEQVRNGKSLGKYPDFTEAVCDQIFSVGERVPVRATAINGRHLTIEPLLERDQPHG